MMAETPTDSWTTELLEKKPLGQSCAVRRGTILHPPVTLPCSLIFKCWPYIYNLLQKLQVIRSIHGLGLASSLTKACTNVNSSMVFLSFVSTSSWGFSVLNLPSLVFWLKTNMFSSVQITFRTKPVGCSRSQVQKFFLCSIWASVKGWTVDGR